ncbi:DUF4393 domain-containing protein [Pasteurella multocida]|uniref:DUF4393 domain-containing protein n=1 Tax=Pasteurella multocida TaxID=747 RepID=UPI0007763CE4|nr:DUF4393 domain-containing protein [Pasteurella multocida]AMM81527.1 hypothetical protein AW43_03630 [Pasteurella multocida subsp. multocida PMTB2.1]APW58142.1 hypothetical protein BV212_08460 [Pasteurella multocida]ATC21375.1 DUF4393 domain-containing protein [Pasteurella multocida]MCH4803379.1 DUF4393 domain-containing protein [Pasteurella multocida]MCL7849518.1 DUF4393 domain-containing protein [Pasteurella multocida]
MSELLSIASGVIGGAISAGALKGPVQTLNDIWYITLGRFSDNKVQEIKQNQTINLEKMKNSLEKEIDKIPEENIKEPKISVVGPALEASKFYMEEDEIRGMFAKLIASSMDKSQSDNIHPSFVEMIKMLSPLDAKNLYYLYSNGDESISQIQVNFESGGYQTFYNHIFLGNPDCQDHSFIEPSIDNLIRLKLIDVTYSEYKTNENLYEKHLSHHLFLSLKSQIEEKIESAKSDIKILEDKNIPAVRDSRGNVLSDIERENLKTELEKNMLKEVELKKGIIQLTALGRNFCKVCL